MAQCFEAKGIDFASLKPDEADPFTQASSDGRGFAVSGGVAKAVVNCIKAKEPEREVLVESAEGLANCKNVKLAKVVNMTVIYLKVWLVPVVVLLELELYYQSLELQRSKNIPIVLIT